MVRGVTRADKAGDFIGKGCLGGKQQGEGAQENSSAGGRSLWLVLWVSFPVVSDQLSCLAHIWSGSGSFLLAHAPLGEDRSQHQGSREVGGLVSSLLLAPPTSSWFLFRAAPRSLSGPPAGRQLMHRAVTVPAKVGHFGHWCPNKSSSLFSLPFIST